MRWISRCVSITMVGSVALLMTAGAAQAAVTGPCRGVGTIVQTSASYDASVVNAITVPRRATVQYDASTQATGKRLAVGEVQIALPPPIGKIDLGVWGHDGKLASATSKSGTYKYNFSKLLAGITVRVSGIDREPGLAPCTGYVDLTIEGRSPLAWASLAATAVAISGVSLSVRARRIH